MLEEHRVALKKYAYAVLDSVLKFAMENKLPYVSIIIPCRNEESFIGKCIDSIIANDYPKNKFEVLVIDGMSDDGTRDIVKGYTQQYSFIKLLDNPEKITPVAFNIGIKKAEGEVIAIMGAHATCEKQYISKCVKYLDEYNADNVGGTMITVPREDTFISKIVVLTLSHKFGVGGSVFRTGAEKPIWVDTVFGGCYKKEVFKKIGLFNEELVHTQDMEFNLRLKAAGGKTLLVPDIVSHYYTRSNFKSFCKNNFKNGFWATYPFKFTNIMPVSLRHLIPLAFVKSLIVSGVLALFFPIFVWLFLFIISLYILTSMHFSAKIAIQKKSIKYLFIMPVMFMSLHIGYGWGSIWGLLKASISKRFWKNVRAILKETK